MNVTILAILGGIILLSVACYAGYLLLQLKKQKELQLRHQSFAIDKRNANIYDNVNILCLAGIQGQCDLSEASIRIYSMMDYLQGEKRIDFDSTYPATAELFHIVKSMPRGEERQAMNKPERMKHNLERHKAEARLSDAIIDELKQLQEQVKPLNNQINIQMV
ncbi:coproporphyrinogen III oxidase [Vibrio sp. 10N.286.49.B3]|uniref:DUF2489 domain-containing protein n=1 Tax=Vibrio sp. 10N.286.49.B3 TaxID=1880855 RepID=UPI000C8308B2|nr:DUF2489 domain-containing protein [Vibrio sp. 10N.286.49.B3]PMH46051.1 coproporphyrinogen III oxidase [Vibrio sp. 10N.286.49.B3]